MSTTRWFRVITHDRNQGKGAAVRSGFQHATSDYRHRAGRRSRIRPERVRRRCWPPILDDKADVVFGSRFLSGRPHRVLYFWHSMGNKLLTLASNMFTGLNLSDMETCYKLFRREVLNRSRSKRTASASSRRSRPRSPKADGGSTKSASPIRDAPTQKERRSDAATPPAPCTASFVTRGSATAFAADAEQQHREEPPPPRAACASAEIRRRQR